MLVLAAMAIAHFAGGKHHELDGEPSIYCHGPKVIRIHYKTSNFIAILEPVRLGARSVLGSVSQLHPGRAGRPRQ